jgi:DNA-directed RNA polymerase subunit RPC12/RpoP
LDKTIKELYFCYNCYTHSETDFLDCSECGSESIVYVKVKSVGAKMVFTFLTDEYDVKYEDFVKKYLIGVGLDVQRIYSQHDFQPDRIYLQIIATTSKE